LHIFIKQNPEPVAVMKNKSLSSKDSVLGGPERIKPEKTSEAAKSNSIVEVAIWSEGSELPSQDQIAEEVAVALVYNGISHVVMMVSPIELEAFALGFSLSEGIINNADELYSCNIQSKPDGLEVSLQISNQRFAQLKDKRRNLVGRTGCGICGAESLQQVRLPSKKIDTNFLLSHEAINRATLSLNQHQPLQNLTGAYHGVAWCDLEGNILELCEDIGRHNALDKLIGKLSLVGTLSREMQGFLLISSRASYEMLQKAAMLDMAIVVAVSAPTAMAIDIAKQTGITLIGFSRKDRHVSYANDWRINSEQPNLNSKDK